MSEELHYKKDGTLDMRYASSKAHVKAQQSRNDATNQMNSQDIVLKKSGTPDMRYNSSKEYVYGTSEVHDPNSLHYRKDGQLDQRYNSSRKCSQTSSASPEQFDDQLHYKADGTLDMRYKSSKEFVERDSFEKQQNSYQYIQEWDQQALPPVYINNAQYLEYPSPKTEPMQSDGQLHYKANGTLDMRYQSSKDYVDKYGNDKSLNVNTRQTNNTKQYNNENKKVHVILSIEVMDAIIETTVERPYDNEFLDRINRTLNCPQNINIKNDDKNCFTQDQNSDALIVSAIKSSNKQLPSQESSDRVTKIWNFVQSTDLLMNTDKEAIRSRLSELRDKNGRVIIRKNAALYT